MDVGKRMLQEIPDLGSEDLLESVLSTSVAVVAGLGTRALLNAAWRRSTGTTPPRDPASRSHGWRAVLAWTVAVSVTVGVARLLARRGTVVATQRLRS